MFKYIVRRILLIIPVMLGVSVIVFGIMHLTPGDPAILMLGEAAPEADLEALRERLGLNEPLYVQYGIWIGRRRAARLRSLDPLGTPGDWTRSARDCRRPSSSRSSRRYSRRVGVPLGILSANRPNSLRRSHGYGRRVRWASRCRCSGRR
jgi:peptide/nickel transport system permease protein